MESDEALELWLRAQPRILTRDPVWRMEAYRIAAFCVHLAWADVSALARHPLTVNIARQLYDALDSIPSNLGEGYSRSSGRDRVRFYEYALGSARECVCHYQSALPVLGAPIALERQTRLRSIVRLLSVAIPAERRRRIDIRRPPP